MCYNLVEAHATFLYNERQNCSRATHVAIINFFKKQLLLRVLVCNDFAVHDVLYCMHGLLMSLSCTVYDINLPR